MSRQSRDDYESESVIPFTPKDAASPETDQLDKAGQTIELLHKAAGVAEANSQHALEMAQKLSHQLRAVYTEIEDRFLRQEDGRRGMTGAPPRPSERKGVKTSQ